MKVSFEVATGHFISGTPHLNDELREMLLDERDRVVYLTELEESSSSLCGNL